MADNQKAHRKTPFVKKCYKTKKRGAHDQGMYLGAGKLEHLPILLLPPI